MTPPADGNEPSTIVFEKTIDNILTTKHIIIKEQTRILGLGENDMKIQYI